LEAVVGAEAVLDRLRRYNNGDSLFERLRELRAAAAGDPLVPDRGGEKLRTENRVTTGAALSGCVGQWGTSERKVPVSTLRRSSASRLERGSYTVHQIAKEFGVSRPTIYRHLAKSVPQAQHDPGRRRLTRFSA